MLFQKIVHSKINLLKLSFCVLLAACLVAAPFIGGTKQADAASANQSLIMSTSYPGVSAKAGDTVSFNLKLLNNSSQDDNVALAVDSIPTGWNGYYQANNSQISRAYVSGINPDTVSSTSATPGNQTNVTFNVAVPADAQNGKYTIDLSASGSNGDKSALQLEIDVSDTQASPDKLVSQYPSLQGAASTGFTFAMNLSNNGGNDQAYGLSSQAPDGWTVAFSSSDSGQQIASLSVAKGNVQGMNVKITPPADAAAGKYTIHIVAQSGKESLTSDLEVNITGTYTLTMTTPSQTFNADAYIGQASPVTFILQNTGSADIDNVSLTSTAPQGWEVKFDPTSADSIPAGQSVQINAYVTPANDAITGDYMVTLSAKSQSVSAQNDFRITVKTSSVWGYIAVIIIIALILVLLLVFRKFGRR